MSRSFFFPARHKWNNFFLNWKFPEKRVNVENLKETFKTTEPNTSLLLVGNWPLTRWIALLADGSVTRRLFSTPSFFWLAPQVASGFSDGSVLHCWSRVGFCLTLGSRWAWVRTVSGRGRLIRGQFVAREQEAESSCLNVCLTGTNASKLGRVVSASHVITSLTTLPQ